MPGQSERWGPLPELARQLGRLAGGSSRQPHRWLAAVEQYGGLWGLYARDRDGRRFWPRSLPPVIGLREVDSPKLGFWCCLLRAIGKWVFPFLRLRARPGARPGAQPIDPDRFAGLLSRCHAWVAQRNLELLERLFAPFWDQLPVEAAAVSSKATAWSLVAYALDTWGLAAVPVGSSTSATRLIPDGFALTGQDPIGSFLSVHTAVDRALATAARRLGLAGTPEGQRRPGGLRSEQFVTAYTALALAAEGRPTRSPAAGWLRVINAMAAASPLTQLVYADLLFPQSSWSEARQADGQARAAVFRGLVPSGPRRRWWHDMWIAHLSRSLVAVVLSPPPVFESRVRRQRASEQYVRERQRRAAYWRRRYRPNLDPQYQRMMRELNALQQREQEQRLARLALLNAILEPGARQPATTYLHVRFLDMLIRHLATRNMAALHRQWVGLSGRGSAGGAGSRLESHRLAVVLLSEQGVLRRRLEEALLGEPVEQCVARLRGRDDDGLVWVSQQLELLLEPPIDLPPEDPNDRLAVWGAVAARLAPRVGVPDESAQFLMTRFGDDALGGLAMSFQPRHPQTFAPATLVSHWVPSILERFSPAGPAAQTGVSEP